MVGWLWLPITYKDNGGSNPYDFVFIFPFLIHDLHLKYYKFNMKIGLIPPPHHQKKIERELTYTS